MINIPNTRKTLELMASDPEHVDQATWLFFSSRCGTVACMAGHAATLVGEWAQDESGDPCVVVDGKTRNIGLVAEDVLGFDDALANAFFLRTSALEGRGAVAVVYRMAEIVTNGEITMPIEFAADYAAMNANPYYKDVGDVAAFFLRDVV
jgi:hypothetical protein